MIVLPVRFRGEFLDVAQGWAGGDIARGDQKLLPDRQRPIRLESVQYQYPLHGDVICFGNRGQRLIGLHFMDDPAICIR